MTIEELREELVKAEKERRVYGDYETTHYEQQMWLLQYIDDQEVTDIFTRNIKIQR